MRKLTIGGVTYLWRLQHRHRADENAPEGRRCQEVLTVYREGRKTAPLRVMFTAGEDRGAGYPEAGVVTIYGPPPESFNLNGPGTVSAIIAQALETGWDPAEDRRPHEVEDGFEVLLAIRERVEAEPRSR